MARKYTVYGINICRGRKESRVIIKTQTKKAALELLNGCGLNMSMKYFTEYGGETYNETELTVAICDKVMISDLWKHEFKEF